MRLGIPIAAGALYPVFGLLLNPRPAKCDQVIEGLGRGAKRLGSLLQSVTGVGKVKPSLNPYVNCHQGQYGAGKIGQLAGDLAKTAESLFSVVETPGSERTSGDQREGQTGAER